MNGLVIFDCDGVLVDSEIFACDIQAKALVREGLPITGAEVARRFLGSSAKDMRAEIEKDLGRALPDDYEAHRLDELFAAFRESLRPVPGIAGVIDAVRAAGLACCVASSSTPQRIALALEVTGLAGHFGDAVFSSTMVARGKPFPDLFLFAARRMGVAPARCTVVEDSVNGIRAATAAAMPCLGFTAGAHCGHGHAEMLAAAGATQVCADAGTLQTALLG